MNSGIYFTVQGSTVEISGKHSGIVEISFDWVEENACVDCYDPHLSDDTLSWSCDECGGGSAELYPRGGGNEPEK